MRVDLKNAETVIGRLPAGTPLWLDVGVDALHRCDKMRNDWKAYLEGFPGGDSLVKCELSSVPHKTLIQRFVDASFEKCTEHDPLWLSIPQVPVIQGVEKSRNSVNRLFATAAEDWRQRRGFGGKLMLPVIVAHKDALNSKTNARNQKLKEIKSALARCNPDGVWVVNADLNDEEGSRPNEHNRLPGLVDFHSELRLALEGIDPKPVVLAGPYWAMNLVLWARGLVDFPVIGLATGFRYYVPGAPLSQAKERVALRPLRRRAEAVPELKAWIEAAAGKLAGHAGTVRGAAGMGGWLAQSAEDFTGLARSYDRLKDEIAHRQVARFYKEWLDSIEAVPPDMRGIFLYQAFSAADVVGRIAGNLPEGVNPRHPGRLARQYMLNCL